VFADIMIFSSFSPCIVSALGCE